MRSTRALAVVAFISLIAAVQPVTAAHAIDPSCTNVSPSAPFPGLPWGQRLYDPANRLWPFSTGAGVTVAVLDTGVDATHFQMGASVIPGFDFLGTSTGTDCDGHGTAVASIIAAQEVSGVGFSGLAPSAKILPVRLDDAPHTTVDGALPPGVLAVAIDYAVSTGASVIAAPAVTADDPALRDAVSRALTAGVVMVAAVGDGQPTGSNAPFMSPTPYPAAYAGVIGVGAVDREGVRAPASQVGDFVDLMAPGVDIIAAGLGGHQELGGTGLAVGFVAAAVALMLGEPGSDVAAYTGTQRVDVITNRLLASANGRGGGSSALAYGAGTLDPYRAMIEAPNEATPEPVSGAQPPAQDEDALRVAAERAEASAWALRIAAMLGAVALLSIAAAVVLPRGRRTRWLPRRDRELLQSELDKRPEFLPGEMLFRESPRDAPTTSAAKSG